MSITKGERTELAQLIRKRERVMKAESEKRSAQMLAEFEAQCASIYSWDDDKVWALAKAAVDAAVKEAAEVIRTRCEEMGIPRQFAPELNAYWYSRGENASKQRREELRRVAKSKIEAVQKEAVARIEVISLHAQTELLSKGLDSEAAQAFLGSLSSIEAMMPSIDALEVKAIVDARHVNAGEGL